MVMAGAIATQANDATPYLPPYPYRCNEINFWGMNLTPEEQIHWRWQAWRTFYCSRDQYPITHLVPPAQASQDCQDLTVLMRLSLAALPNPNNLALMTGRQQVACALSTQGTKSITTWPNGNTARFSQNWYYPNGTTGKFGTNWYYPNGQSAKFASTWYYANGQSAKFGDRWYYPNGQSADSTDILGWACGVVGPYLCQDRLESLANASPFWYDLTIVELGSMADYLDRTLPLYHPPYHP